MEISPPECATTPENRIPSMAERIALIPPHQSIHFRLEDSKLLIVVDFVPTGPSPEASADHLLDMINILPHYALEASKVSVGFIFNSRELDDLSFNQARHLVIARIVEEVNQFQNLMVLRILIMVRKFHWDQILGPVSAIYGFKHPFPTHSHHFRGWDLGLREVGKKTQIIHRGSSLDRALHERFLGG